MCNREFPEKFLKGAPNKDSFDETFSVMLYGAWEKWDISDTMIGYEESSVNWYDSDEALRELQEKETVRHGTQCRQFIGCFVLSTKELQNCIKKHQKILQYGRCPLENNPFHGNIYRSSNLPKQTKTTLMSHLTNAFIEFIDFDER